MIVFLCLSLGGCTVTQHVPVYTEVQKTPLNLPPYEDIKFEEVHFKVIQYLYILKIQKVLLILNFFFIPLAIYYFIPLIFSL